MTSFIDPRANPSPCSGALPAQTAAEREELNELHQLCREGRLYEVERWIRDGRALQTTGETTDTRRRVATALEIALENGNHALVLLLLCDGYDTDGEHRCPLDLALRSRRWDLLDLLLEWGADPHRVSLSDLFGTYSSDLFGRFRDLGVDLTEGHELAETLAYHTSNKPLFGFAKRHRDKDCKIQTELNIALAHHAGDGNQKGVALCLWAGADPHAPAASLRYTNSYEKEDGFIGFSAIYEACISNHAVILRRLSPDPFLDDFDELYRAASSGPVIDLLAESSPPRDVGAVIHSNLRRATWHSSQWRSVHTLRRVFEVGGRWEESSKQAIAGVRQLLLKTSDQTFVDLMKLLAMGDHCSSEIRKELARTPAMRAKMKKVGFYPPSPDQKRGWYTSRPTRSREVLSKFGADIPKPKKPEPRLPFSVQIGTRHPAGTKITMDRATLLIRVWSEPVAKVAQEWGISGPGLAKACRRLSVPVPPRGFWAKKSAGQRVRRPRLPKLQPGEAEEIVVWVRE